MARSEDSNSRPSGSKPFDLLCQVLPEEWLIERIQQVAANSRNLLSLSLIAICGISAAVFCGLRYILMTASRSSRPPRIPMKVIGVPV
jgi:hypothetical protein